MTAKKLSKPKPKSYSKAPATRSPDIYKRIREILASARAGVARTVNTTQVVSNWVIGREIVEDEQKGIRRAGYGDALLKDLSSILTRDFGRGYSVDNLESFRLFYSAYPSLIRNPRHCLGFLLRLRKARRYGSPDRSTLLFPGAITGYF